MVTKIKEKASDWTLNSPATDEVIEAYCQGLDRQNKGDIANNLRKLTAEYCKREANAYWIMSEQSKRNKPPTLETVAHTAITYFEGLKRGFWYVIEELKKPQEN